MTVRIALCAEEELVRNPALLGLDGEDLEAQHWLDVYVEGAAAREAIAHDDEIGQAWVVSCSDVEPINLAAALKADRPALDVRLVHQGGDGSLLSRAHTALIDGVVTPEMFLRLYADRKAALGGAHQVDSGAHEADAGAYQADAGSHQADLGAYQVAFSAQRADSKTQRAGSDVRQTTTPALALPNRVSTASAPTLAQQKRAFILPVVSGSGGAGKSSVSVTSAFLAHLMGYRTLLLDYDLQFGDAAVLAGVQDPLTLDVAMSRPDLLEREIGDKARVSVLAPPHRLEMAESVVRGLPDLLDALAPRFDVIVANTGAAWAEQHAALLERSSAALFLVDQRASSVRACLHALDLCERCGIATGPFRFAVNRCAKGAPLTSIDVSCAMKGVTVFELKDGGRDVEDYLSGGAVKELVDSRNEFSESLKPVLSKLLPDGEHRSVAAGKAQEPKGASRKRGRHVGRRRIWGQS